MNDYLRRKYNFHINTVLPYIELNMEYGTWSWKKQIAAQNSKFLTVITTIYNIPTRRLNVKYELGVVGMSRVKAEKERQIYCKDMRAQHNTLQYLITMFCINWIVRLMFNSDNKLCEFMPPLVIPVLIAIGIMLNKKNIVLHFV